MPHAAVVHRTDAPMKIEEVTYRAPKDDEVLVRLSACGVCHSDLSALNEYFPTPLPTILGHEAAGVVLEVGAKVRAVAAGDRVVAIWKPSCGTCRYCKSGKRHLCYLGEDTTSAARDRAYLGADAIALFMGIGGFAEQTLLHETALVKIDPAMPLDRAALIGCGVLTGYGAATNAARVEEGWEVAVFGCGGVGLNIIQGAKARGAGSIVAIDLDDAKLERARAFGATHVLRADAPKLHKAIRDLTFEKQGVDCAFDAVGSVEVAAIAYRSICKGGVVTLVGIDRMERTFPVSSFQSVLQEKRIQGSLGGSADNYQQVRDLIRLYQSGDLKLDELLTRRYRLNEVNEAMDDLRNGKNARGVIVLE